MRIVAISDTHGKHKGLELPKGDMIIHAGDVSRRGSRAEVIDFLNWYDGLDFKYKIFIAGNHDFYFENTEAVEIQRVIPETIHYLCDSGIELDGLMIWGSPIQPWFFDWAFNRQRGQEISKHWDIIPNETDILITHGPPFGILDKTYKGENVGCEELTKKVSKMNLKAHIFGHIHEAHGRLDKKNTEFLNASVLDLKYNLVNKPLTLDVE